MVKLKFIVKDGVLVLRISESRQRFYKRVGYLLKGTPNLERHWKADKERFSSYSNFHGENNHALEEFKQIYWKVIQQHPELSARQVADYYKSADPEPVHHTGDDLVEWNINEYKNSVHKYLEIVILRERAKQGCNYEPYYKLLNRCIRDIPGFKTMADVILQKFFEIERWERAIEKGVIKDIRKDQLIKLTSEETRLTMAKAMKDGRYEISPPHTAKIPKDNGDFRTVYVNEPIDRIVLSIANDLLFELMPEMVHKSCKSYQTGIGCGAVVIEASKTIVNANTSNILGWKADLSKYFDSVPIIYIDRAFDKVEAKYGHSVLIDVLRKYYHNDLYFDEHNKLCSNYQSLKQGCAVASWLADVLLYGIDEELSGLKGYYVRYSDDMLYIGSDYQFAMKVLQRRLEEMNMKLNPAKVEYLSSSRWFKFLGFSIKGKDISLSSSRIKTFQKEIESRTIKKPGISLERAVHSINRYLYKGNGEFSWATQILPVCNVKNDIDELNKFVMDCLRATVTGKRKVGGLGYVRTKTNGCVVRGRGKNVTANRNKTSKIDGYLTIGCMRNALLTNRSVYNTLVLQL